MYYPMATEREKLVYLTQKVSSVGEAEEMAVMLLQQLNEEDRVEWQSKLESLRGVNEYRDYLADLQNVVLSIGKKMVDNVF